jgi:hypothetical protein
MREQGLQLDKAPDLDESGEPLFLRQGYGHVTRRNRSLGGKRMPKPCLKKKDSAPPVCSIHNVPLLSKQLPAELIGGGYKSFTYLVCPVSGSVLNDEEKQE